MSDLSDEAYRNTAMTRDIPPPKAETEDVVNHPSHYNQYQGFEVMDVCEQLRGPDGEGNWYRGNVFKYLARAGWKDPSKELQDLEKAMHYLKREIDRVKAAQAPQVSRVSQTAVVQPKVGPVCFVCETPMFAGNGFYECRANGCERRQETSRTSNATKQIKAPVIPCPHCDSLLESFSVPPGDEVFVCPDGHVTLKLLKTHPVCPKCQHELQPILHDPSSHLCTNGCGSYRTYRYKS